MLKDAREREKMIADSKEAQANSENETATKQQLKVKKKMQLWLN
jgi:hypothetical protein